MTLPKPLPPIAILQQFFRYDAHTGNIYWLRSTSNRVRTGDIAGKINSCGYVSILLHKRRLLAHRIAWILFYDKDPPRFIDHRDTNRANNRIENIREASQSQNMGNARRSLRNSSGIKGVSYDLKRKKYVAYIRIARKLKHLGRFDTLAQAARARQHAATNAWGLFARHT